MFVEAPPVVNSGQPVLHRRFGKALALQPRRAARMLEVVGAGDADDVGDQQCGDVVRQLDGGHRLRDCDDRVADDGDRVHRNGRAERQPNDEIHGHDCEQQAHEDARLSLPPGRQADPGHSDQCRCHRDRDVARVPGVGARDEGDRECHEQQRQHDAGAREVGHDPADHRHDHVVDLDHRQADGREDREVDA